MPDDQDLIEDIQETLQAALSETFGVDVSLDSVPDGFLADLAQRVQEGLAAPPATTPSSAPTADNGQHPRNRLNDLSGAEWLWFTKSVLRTTYPSILGHEIRKRQGGNKPPQLMADLIRFFTKAGECVLDPFGGAGGTALGAHLAGRSSVSIEINPESVTLYHAVCEQEGIAPHPFIQGDCREVLAGFQADQFDFIATDPPYSPELEQTMSGEAASALYGRTNRRSSYVTYSEDPRDLSKCPTFDTFFDALDEVGRAMWRVLKPRRYLALILRDAYQNGEYIHTSAIVAQRYRTLGWTFKGEKIWYSTGVRIRPYGYPSAFVPNIIHQNILIFRKE
jgi:DNA modification methylase